MNPKETGSSKPESLPIEDQQSDGEDVEQAEEGEPFEVQPDVSDRDETIITYRGAKIHASKTPRDVEQPALPARATSPQQSVTADDDNVIIYRGVRTKRSR
jgi:hypothetical protein